MIRTGGGYRTVLATLARTELLIIDDWGLQMLDDQGRHDLLEILEDRYNVRSTLVTNQLPVPNWHEAMGTLPWLRPSSTGLSITPIKSTLRESP